MANATNFIKSPHPGTVSKGPIQAQAYNIAGTDIWLNLPFNGLPTALNGVGWAAKGSSGVDTTSGIWYSNIGSAAVPNWQNIGAQ